MDIKEFIEAVKTKVAKSGEPAEPTQYEAYGIVVDNPLIMLAGSVVVQDLTKGRQARGTTVAILANAIMQAAYEAGFTSTQFNTIMESLPEAFHKAACAADQHKMAEQKQAVIDKFDAFDTTVATKQ